MQYRAATFVRPSRVKPCSGGGIKRVDQGDTFRVVRIEGPIVRIGHPERGDCYALVNDVSISETVDNAR